MTFQTKPDQNIDLNDLIDEFIRLNHQASFSIQENTHTNLIPHLITYGRFKINDAKKFKAYLNQNANHFPIDHQKTKYAIYNTFVNQLIASGNWIDWQDAGLAFQDASFGQDIIA